MNILVVDYNAGNLASLANSLIKVSQEINKEIFIKVSRSPKDVSLSDKVILPGVGDFSNCKKQLENIDGMVDSLYEHSHILSKPFLGICIGMQLMAESSEERGKHRGLSYFDAIVDKIDINNCNIKIPHMGWNTVNVENKEIKDNFKSLDNKNFYFVHSYKMVCKNKSDVLASVQYGRKIVAAICKENIIGVQFHPEKSQKEGLNFLKEFILWKP